MSNTRIVKFVDTEGKPDNAALNAKLRECMAYNAKHPKKKLNFSQFLAQNAPKNQ